MHLEFFAEMLRSKLKRTDGMPIKPKSAENTPSTNITPSPKLVARRFVDTDTTIEKVVRSSYMKKHRSGDDTSSEEVVRSTRGVAPAVEPSQTLNTTADSAARRARQMEIEQVRICEDIKT